VQLLDGIPPRDYLCAVRRNPTGDVEPLLLELSDRQYGVTVRVVEAWFAGGDLRFAATSAMEVLNGINGLLARSGLLPDFVL
jgi:hypothetical protein